MTDDIETMVEETDEIGADADVDVDVDDVGDDRDAADAVAEPDVDDAPPPGGDDDISPEVLARHAARLGYTLTPAPPVEQPQYAPAQEHYTDDELAQMFYEGGESGKKAVQYIRQSQQAEILGALRPVLEPMIRTTARSAMSSLSPQDDPDVVERIVRSYLPGVSDVEIAHYAQQPVTRKLLQAAIQAEKANARSAASGSAKVPKSEPVARSMSRNDTSLRAKLKAQGIGDDFFQKYGKDL